MSCGPLPLHLEMWLRGSACVLVTVERTKSRHCLERDHPGLHHPCEQRLHWTKWTSQPPGSDLRLAAHIWGCEAGKETLGTRKPETREQLVVSGPAGPVTLHHVPGTAPSSFSARNPPVGTSLVCMEEIRWLSEVPALGSAELGSRPGLPDSQAWASTLCHGACSWPLCLFSAWSRGSQRREASGILGVTA